MSDLMIGAGLALNGAKFATELSWTRCTKSWSEVIDKLTWIITRVDDPNTWSPAKDPSHQLTALVAGRFAFDEKEWQRAESMPYEGGLAASLVLDRWLNYGATGIENLNGAGIAVILDTEKLELHLWTDRLGFYPIFAWTDGGFLICSNADVAASALSMAGRRCSFDQLTMCRVLKTGTATQPFTYWSGINQLDSGTYYRFSFSDRSRLVEHRRYC